MSNLSAISCQEQVTIDDNDEHNDRFVVDQHP